MTREEYLTVCSPKIGMASTTFLHQFIINSLQNYMSDYVWSQNYMIATEMALTLDLNDVQPDVLVASTTYQPLLIVEVAKSYQIPSLKRKVNKIISRFPTIEAFIFDYEKFYWYSNQDKIAGTIAYSPLLGIDLDDCFTDEIIDRMNKCIR